MLMANLFIYELLIIVSLLNTLCCIPTAKQQTH